MDDCVVVGSIRTPIGRFGGSLSSVSATELGAHAIRAALERSGVAPADVGYVVMGHALQAGQGQITSRQAAVGGGVGMGVAAETVNKVCLSGMTAIARGRDLVRLGEFDVVVVGGMESMSRAPYVVDGARFGLRLGDGTLTDVVLHDGLTCAFDACSMGTATDDYQERNGLAISREQQDEWSVRSHERAAKGWRSGLFATEVVDVPVQQHRGEQLVVSADEGVREETSIASLARLPVAFRESGTITAGNASQVSDGAAALVLMSRRRADELQLPVLATIRSWGTVAGPDASLHLQPAGAIRDAARRVGDDAARYDLYEINEAFASVAIASTRELGLDEDRVNVHGGAVALGHPIGCSGARLVVTLITALRDRGGGTGVAALCGGGGQGDALVVLVE